MRVDFPNSPCIGLTRCLLCGAVFVWVCVCVGVCGCAVLGAVPLFP